MNVETQALSVLRDELQRVIAGSFFVFMGLIGLLIAAVRPRRSGRLLIWVGFWSGMYGINKFLQSQAVVEALPPSFDSLGRLLAVVCTYVIVVVATLTFLELTLGLLRRFLQVHLVADIAIAAAAIAWYLATGSANTFLFYNKLLTAVLLSVLVVTLCVPQLSRRFLVLARHRVLTVGALIFSAEALWVNIARPLRITEPEIFSTLGFAVFLLSVGYTGLEIVILDERRLLSLDNELAIARQLQFSILPEGVPEIANLKIAAVYEPMTAVAGDFYEFLAIDDHRIGFLVADVSGHGVPAALIASMIKVAGQSLQECAAEPGEVLRRLGAILSPHLRGQFVTAAYLCIDTQSRTGQYSAAGHPPLLWWRTADNCLARVESNGLLFGVMPGAQYPVCKLSFTRGDRIVLCTDGITEPENASGEAFGDLRMEKSIRDNPACSASELSQHLLDDLRAWQPPSFPQHDDITLIVIDVL